MSPVLLVVNAERYPGRLEQSRQWRSIWNDETAVVEDHLLPAELDGARPPVGRGQRVIADAQEEEDDDGGKVRDRARGVGPPNRSRLPLDVLYDAHRDH